MTLTELSSYLNTASPRITKRCLGAMNRSSIIIRDELRRRAPVESGAFRASWRVAKARVDGNRIVSGVFNRRSYAVVIEGGSGIGEPPWPSTASAGRKVTLQDGRIWSKKAVGGTVAPMFTEGTVLIRVTQEIADSSLKGIFDGG